ncbi:MAG: primosomal protein N' [bacterium]|nr:primosomal protein N' [bacterium]
MKNKFVNVALDIPLNTVFTYKVPEYFDNEVEIGMRVLVNFGKKMMTGIITDVMDFSLLERVREVRSVLDRESIFSDELMKFCIWLSGYYLAPIGEVLFSVIPRNINIKSDAYFFLTQNYRRKLDSVSLKEELLIDIIRILENTEDTGLTKKQIENKIKTVDAGKLTAALVEAGILYSKNLYSKPTKIKIQKVITSNFSTSDIEVLIKENKIRSVNQKKLIEALAINPQIESSEAKTKYNSGPAVISSLLAKGLITIKEVRSHRNAVEIFSEESKSISLNDEQSEALKKIDETVDSSVFKTFLLFGVTGSGKTEVYINAIKNALGSGKTAIVLVPEISLTPQLIHRFKKVFDDKVGVIHSKLSDGEKLDTYDRILDGTFRIIIGARSAVFAPLKNIGIIIVDEEHDTSYKQENSPKYNGRDAAIYRARLNDAVIVLGSATPSIESYHNAQSGKYELLNLRSRVADVKLPEIKILDLLKSQKREFEEDRKDFFDSIDKVKVKFLSKELIYEIGERLSKKESIIILQNRRGYHSYLECLNCGNVEMCIRCNIALTYHKAFDLLKCHYCGFSRKFVKKCSVCSSSMLIPKGAGTERVEEELIKIFPSAVIQRMDSDTLISKKLYQKILKDFYDGKIDILAGTQIISKGLDFPNVTLVGVVNADIGLLNPDFRATEKTFQILTQVSGRSGRSDKKGEVLIQTNHSDFYVFEDVRKNDYLNFFENEIKIRRQLNYPPFSRITIIEAKSEDRLLAESKIKEIFNFLKQSDSLLLLEVLPPIAPLFSKLKDKYRFHLLIKSAKEKDQSGKYLKKILNEVRSYAEKNIPKKVLVTIDVDAVNLL